MNEKEVAEIRRRFKPGHNSMTQVRGCYVNERHEIVSRFEHSMALNSQDDCEKLLTILKKTLSGTIGKNLIDLSFTTQQVVQGAEHKRLMKLRESGLMDEDAVNEIFTKTVQNIDLESPYVILMVQDKYDVPYRGKDGSDQDDAGSEVYNYILCSICPVKQLKPALGFKQNEFHGILPDPIVCAPELGFLFPAFDDRSTNIYNTLLYTRDSSLSYQEFVDAIFGDSKPVIPAATQKELFHSVLSETLEEECSFEVVQTVNNQLGYLIDEHKASKDPEPLVIGKDTVKQALDACGVSEDKISAFEEKYDAEFGADKELSPKNLIENKIIVKTPSVVIQVDPDRSDLIDTRIIDGKKYILIRADEGAEVNGVPVKIKE